MLNGYRAYQPPTNVRFERKTIQLDGNLDREVRIVLSQYTLPNSRANYKEFEYYFNGGAKESVDKAEKCSRTKTLTRDCINSRVLNGFLGGNVVISYNSHEEKIDLEDDAKILAQRFALLGYNLLNPKEGKVKKFSIEELRTLKRKK